MITNKHIGKFTVALVALAVIALSLFGIFADASTGLTMAYEKSLFDTSEIMELNIKIPESDWEALLANAVSEEYYTCDITINGTTCYNVGIRAKGNTSLSSVASSGSDRYSFKVQFDEYVSGQTFDGLDKLVLNNNFSDATMMKEALVYDMFAFLGADASLYNYAKVSVNGEYKGVYVALESVEESFLMRNNGLSYGELYKPDNLDFAGAGNMRSVDIDYIRQELGFGDAGESAETGSYGDSQSMPNNLTPPYWSGQVYSDSGGASGGTVPDSEGLTLPDDLGNYFRYKAGEQSGGWNFNRGGNFGGGGMNSGGSGTSLSYTNDELDSYSDIWESSVFDTTDSDHERVVAALKNIGEGTDLEEYMDVDNVLRYLAVQTFVVNLDSLTGTMEHNYYLYEEDGWLNILPWDYNLSFGGFGDTASSMINFPIDTPFSGDTSDRGFFMALLENDEYLSLYHQYLSRLVDEYVNGGSLDAFYSRVRGQIDDLVETDPTSFYTYDEYNMAVTMLHNTVLLRAESIKGQLDGSIPSTSDGQAADSDSLIDASSIILKQWAR